MSSARHFEIAAEFCKLVGTPSLFDYLGVQAGADASEARGKLKKRRKYMQGMQSNPKYKEEALFLIKHFSYLDKSLAEPDAYGRDVAQRKESEQIPILEMTIKGVLAGGTLSDDQEAFLRKNALELGISETTFRQLLTRLKQEAGLASGPVPALPHMEFTDEITDYYGVLGVVPNATMDEIESAYARVQHSAAAQKAYEVLSNHISRRTFDLARRRTGPPARSREDAATSPSEAATAPPVRPRTAMGQGAGRVSPTIPTLPLPVGQMTRGSLQGQAAATGTPAEQVVLPRLEVLGDPVRTVRIGRGVATREIIVRNGGQGMMPGRVATDQPWLIASPSILDPYAIEQPITVRINAADLVQKNSTGVVAIQTERGERASVVFEAIHGINWVPIGLFLLLLPVAVGAAIVIASLLLSLGSPGDAEGLTIQVDPGAEEILLDGRVVGSGQRVFLPDPPTGSVTLTVTHRNFKEHSQELTVTQGEPIVVPVVLELAKTLDFVPTAEMKKDTLDQTVAQRIMGPVSRAMDNCVRAAVEPGDTLSGSVRIHVGPSGEAVGIEVQGDGADNPTVRSCLERQGAAVIFHKLTDGEYATVRYDYRVTEASSH